MLRNTRTDGKMARKRKWRYFVCDFETTVYEGQTNTEVWASACVEMYTEDVKILHSIDETFAYFKSLKCNMVCYYHNLKFDGSFWLDYLLSQVGMKQAVTKTGENEYDLEFDKNNRMQNNTFKYSISDKGMWYTITIKVNDYMIELRDSLKLLPFSVKAIGESFKTKHQKLDMEYKGFRYAGCEITEEEKKYIANDVLVVKEALEIMFDQGHNKLTIGACCLAEYKIIMGRDYDNLFPNVYDIPCDVIEGLSAGDYIRRSYKGGWCYLCRGKENRIYHGGVTADVNSLYPSVMSSESGSHYPVGKPRFWKGNFIPDEATENNRYWFVRIKTRFYLKEGMLPFIQIKGSWLYDGNEALESSDYVNKKTGIRSAFYRDFDGNLQSTRVELTMTCTDYILFREHYNVIDFEILDGCYFESMVGIFDEYIEKYKKIKLESKGALRTLAKLFLNNLYGKMASSEDSSFKYAYVKEDKSIGFVRVKENGKTPGYIPVGSAITSYARNFTIRAAQKNFHGVDKPGFIYADTDSIHCDLKPEEVVGITVHDKNFCCWKLESTWDEAIFVRQKTYIEHVVEEDCEPIDSPYYNIKCAGMPERCKDLFQVAMGSKTANTEELSSEQKAFLKKGAKTLSDFKIGLKIPGKLMPKRIRGGILLVDGYYEMRNK